MDIPTFSGSRFRLGQQLGTYCREAILKEQKTCQTQPPPLPQNELSAALIAGWTLTQQAHPAIAEELRGMSVGAGIPLRDLFLIFYEDLWDLPDSKDTGCTSMVARRSATGDGSTLVGHNNDMHVTASKSILIRLQPEDGPEVLAMAFTEGTLSVGANSHGLVLVGNQLTSSDVKPGIPRFITTRALLDAKTLEEGIGICMDPRRASSYNNILVDATGRVADVEGSGTSGKLIPVINDTLSHSNHYIHPRMLRFEMKEDKGSSLLRLQRSRNLLKEKHGQHTLQTFQDILRDHEGYPGSICRHGGKDEVVTGCSVIVEVEKRILWYCPKTPCRGIYQAVSY